MFKTWNGNGSTTFGHAHSWGGYVNAAEFDKHPEFFAQNRDGKRVPRNAQHQQVFDPFADFRQKWKGARPVESVAEFRGLGSNRQ